MKFSIKRSDFNIKPCEDSYNKTVKTRYDLVKGKSFLENNLDWYDDKDKENVSYGETEDKYYKIYAVDEWFIDINSIEDFVKLFIGAKVSINKRKNIITDSYYNNCQKIEYEIIIEKEIKI